MSWYTSQNLKAKDRSNTISSCCKFEDIVGKQHRVYLYSCTIPYFELTNQILTKRIIGTQFPHAVSLKTLSASSMRSISPLADSTCHWGMQRLHFLDILFNFHLLTSPSAVFNNEIDFLAKLRQRIERGWAPWHEDTRAYTSPLQDRFRLPSATQRPA